MSPVEFQPVSSESNQSGLTFVRPLPGNTPQQQEPISSVHRPYSSDEFARMLFPPRGQEESGQISPTAGLELGHFVIQERIGRGGMGAVFRAVDRRLDRIVALKILSPDLSSEPDAVQRFQNEARAAAKLDHDNIARVHYVGEDKGLHFIAFEFVTGTNVREFILQKGCLPQQDAVNYTLQIAEALRHTSAANVVHRDVKPSNIIIAPNGRAKLVDLGLARHQPADQSKDLTVAGTALGTFDYIAPEQAIDARNVDVRSDIYALGCTLYHMLTGEPPYPKGTMFQKVINHHGHTPPSAKDKNPSVSVQLTRVIQKMMASNPDERYSSADALIHDLVQIAESLNLKPTQPDAVVWTTPLFKATNPYWDSSRTWMAVALVLLLLVYLVDRMQPGQFNDQIASNGSIETTQNSPNVQNPSKDKIGEVLNNISERTVDSSTTYDESLAGVNDVYEEPETRPSEVKSGTAPVYEPLGTGSSFASIGLATSESVEKTELFWDSLSERTAQSTKMAEQTSNGMKDLPESSSVSEEVTKVTSQSSVPFLVTSSKAGESVEVATVAEAFHLAADNSVIEIRASGLLPVQESSVQLSNKRVVLRAGEGYDPIIRFDLRNELTLRPLANTAYVFDLGNGATLELYDINIELLVDARTTVDEWTFVQVSPGTEIESRWSSFRMINPDNLPASLIYLPTSEASDISRIMPERMSGRPSSVLLRDCIVRGEMDGFKQRELHPIGIILEESAFAIGGTLYHVDGSIAVETNMTTESNRGTTFTLNHVTAILGENLLSATTGDHGTLEQITLDLRNSVISLPGAKNAAVTLFGHLDTESLKEKLEWVPQSDVSIIDINGPIYTIESTASIFFEPQPVSPTELPVTLLPPTQQGVFQSEPFELPLLWSVFPVENFLLDNAPENPAIKSASDGRDAGVDWSRSGLSSGKQTGLPSDSGISRRTPENLD